MDVDILKSKLEAAGELMVLVEEFDEPIELHLHDTDFEGDLVTVDLSDGKLWFDADSVTGAWKHYHSTDDYGL